MKKSFIFTAILIVLCYQSYSQWEEIIIYGTGNGGGTYGFASIGSNLFVTSYISSTGGGVYKSVNNGANWLLINNGLTNIKIRCLESSGNYLYAGADYMNSSNNGGMFISTNSGSSWYPSNSGLNASDKKIMSIKASNNTVYVSCLAYKVFKSNDYGSTWFDFNQGLPAFNNGNSFTLYNGSIFMPEQATLNGIIRKRDESGGSNWITLNTNGSGSDNEVKQIYVVNNTLFAATSSGIYKSVNSGQTWTIVLANVLARAITGYGNTIICGLFSGGFRITTDMGNTWTALNEGIIGDPVIVSMFVYNGYLFAGKPSAKILRRSLSSIGINNISTQVPNKFVLLQNYPNPFNPATNIEFSLPKQGVVELIIYNALGKQVAVLVNGNLNAGTYRADWDASEYPSGVYFYKLVTQDFIETKKMVLLK